MKASAAANSSSAFFAFFNFLHVCFIFLSIALKAFASASVIAFTSPASLFYFAVRSAVSSAIYLGVFSSNFSSANGTGSSSPSPPFSSSFYSSSFSSSSPPAAFFSSFFSFLSYLTQTSNLSFVPSPPSSFSSSSLLARSYSLCCTNMSKWVLI